MGERGRAISVRFSDGQAGSVEEATSGASALVSRQAPPSGWKPSLWLIASIGAFVESLSVRMMWAPFALAYRIASHLTAMPRPTLAPRLGHPRLNEKVAGIQQRIPGTGDRKPIAHRLAVRVDRRHAVEDGLRGAQALVALDLIRGDQVGVRADDRAVALGGQRHEGERHQR
jgi:hypothetical protein